MSDRYDQTASGILVPKPAPDTSWSHRFTTGEIIPLKGTWFRVIHVNTEGNIHGVALEVLKPTTKAFKSAETRRRREARSLRVVEGGRK